MGRIKVESGHHLFAGLNPSQKEVVNHKQGALVVCATAGSGKTESMVRLMAMLVNDEVNPSHILATTFTSKAANEMNQRLKKHRCFGARVGTIHSICLECIRDGSPWANYKVDATERMGYLLKDILGYKQMNWKGVDKTEVEQFISHCKNNVILPEDSAKVAEQLGKDGRMAQAYFLYEEQRHKESLITFDDMLMASVLYLRSDQDALTRWSGRFSHVIVDEFQDTNLAQYEFLVMLATGSKMFVVVGDDDQAIYEWRGAMPKYMIDFEKRFNARVIKMETNYRSVPEVIETANKVIVNNAIRIAKQGIAHRPTNDGKAVNYQSTETMDTEAEVVMNHIKNHESDGSRWGDMTILYRVNAMSRAFEETFITNNIPYIVIGGVDFYKRKEIQDILAYLRLAIDSNDDKSAKRAINKPFRFIGKATLDRLDELAHHDKVSFLVACKCARQRMGGALQARQLQSIEDFVAQVGATRADLDASKALPDVLTGILERTGYERWLLQEEGSDTAENSRVSNLRELVRSSSRFKSANAMIDHIDYIAKEKAKRKNKGEDAVKPNLVQLMTIHRSKGLEFPIVFVAGVSETILPHVRTVNIEEERRLFYVAVTRAREKLYVTSPLTAFMRAQVVCLEPSRFVYEAGLSKKEEENDQPK